jgi:hypothetical protein
MTRLILVVIAACVTSVAASGPAGAQSGGVRVFFPVDCMHNVFRPQSITVACADDNFRVTKIRWASYGQSSASGSGRARIDTCDPDCVSGTFRTYRVRVQLSRVRQCGDVPQFTQLVVTFRGMPPSGFTQTERQRFQCAEAPTG